MDRQFRITQQLIQIHNTRGTRTYEYLPNLILLSKTTLQLLRDTPYPINYITEFLHTFNEMLNYFHAIQIFF